MPSWKGFNISVHKGSPILQSRIHYLDYIYTLQGKALQFTKFAYLSDFQKIMPNSSSASVKRILLNCLPAQDGIVTK